MTPRPRSHDGLSLLHVLLLLVGLGVLASVAIPAWFHRPAVTLDSAARLLASDLRWAQDRAAFLGSRVEVRLDEEGDGYRVVDGQGRLLPAPLGPRPFVRQYSIDAVFRGVTIAGEDRFVGYDGNGRAELPASFVLHFRGARREVLVEAPSGRIHVDGLERTWSEPVY